MNQDDLLNLDAHDQSRLLHAREVSCRELMGATLARMERLNPRLNAIVNLAPREALLAQADERDAELARGQSRGLLHGLPQAVKDASALVGFPTTRGSPLLHDFHAPQDSIMAARMRAAGAIFIGRTNVPEFGLGSHTYNRVFGATGNAWDVTRTAGGSSGGAAVALAQRLLAVADGSDFMGSLRNPAGWNHVFGLRPSQGRVPYGPVPEVYVTQLVTEGPMARTVRDLAGLLNIQAGPHPAAPLSFSDGVTDFIPASGATARGLRIGWLGDMGGHLPMEDGVLVVCEQALQRLQADGAVIQPLRIHFDLHELWLAWLLWRRALVAPNVAAVLDRPHARAHIKPEALWEYDQAQGLSQTDFMRAASTRSAWYQTLRGLFEHYDALALPTAQMWPFDVTLDWPKALSGRAMDTYHRWMEVTLYATFAGLPAISVPAGFHANGRWPMGLQLIGKPRGDAALLQLAAAYERQATELLARRPSEPAA